MDALNLLEKEHVTVKGLLKKLESAEKPAERERLFREVHEDLRAHEMIEEEIFYPALREHPKAKDIVLESLVEHDVVDRLLGELQKMKGSDEMFAAKAKVMKENVEHHIEEEEGEMFRKARQVFDKAELEDLGERMTRRRVEIDRDGTAAGKKR